MKPETIKRLQENIPELKELIGFLASEAAKLNTLDGLEAMTDKEQYEAVNGKIWAYKTITAMLAPLVGVQDTVIGVDPKEYVA